MPTPLFNPDHSTSVLLANGQNPAIRESYTIAQILSFAASLGNDSVIIKPYFVNYDQTACYYQIYSFNLGTISKYYVASGDWYDSNPETQSDIFIQSIAGSTGLYEQCKVIALTNNGLSNTNTVQYSVISTLKTKDDINYLDFNWDIYGRQTDTYIFATNANIGTLYINGSPLVSYQWSSVPSISGKNGILSLTEILNINDGNAVNDVALSGNISLSSSSRISAIISGIIQNEGSATVKYSVPSNIYSYIKLVYKQDKIPTTVNDGTAVDLDPTATSIDVMGFSKTVGTKYYLVIFTDKSTSDEYSYEVGNPPPRFSIPKKFVSDNGTFNYNIPSWIEDRVLSVLRTDPSTTTIYFDVENYPEVANLYSHQFVEYPLQFRTYYGTYPETGSRPATSNYIAKDYKLEWLWTSGSAYRDETDYLKTNGEWSSVYTQGSSFSRADNNYESFVAEMFILDHIEKKGYPAYFMWAHSENWSGRKYQCQINKMGTNSRYADLATAIYNALK